MNFKTKEDLYSARDMKVEARAQLSGNWKEAVLLSLVPVLFSVFFVRDLNQSIENQTVWNNVINLFLQMVQGFLMTGVSFTFLDFIRDRGPIEPLRGSVQAFQGKYFTNLFLLKVLKNVYLFLWTLLLIVPGLIKTYSYSQAERIYKDKVDLTGEIPRAKDCLRESQEMMDGRKLDLFTLDLSFIGWYFLGFLTLGIGFLWITPYTEMSQTVFYQNTLHQEQGRNEPLVSSDPTEVVGKDPDDFSDFNDF